MHVKVTNGPVVWPQQGTGVVGQSAWTPVVQESAYGEQCADTDGLAAACDGPGQYVGSGLAVLAAIDELTEAERAEFALGAAEDAAQMRQRITFLEARANHLVDEVDTLTLAVSKLAARAEQAERNLETAIRERDALRVELNQRMALPPNALKHTKGL